MRIKRIETKTNTNKVFNKKPMPFKRPIKPVGKNSHNFQGEIVKPKMQKKVNVLLPSYHYDVFNFVICYENILLCNLNIKQF